jgi:hypothetical protein
MRLTLALLAAFLLASCGSPVAVEPALSSKPATLQGHLSFGYDGIYLTQGDGNPGVFLIFGGTPAEMTRGIGNFEKVPNPESITKLLWKHRPIYGTTNKSERFQVSGALFELSEPIGVGKLCRRAMRVKQISLLP